MMEMDSGFKRENHVKSILKAFQIIEELDRFGELSIAELSQSLSMNKATVHRLVNTVKEAGYVVQSADTKKYANSIKLYTIGSHIVQRAGVKEVARPYLEAVAEKTKETINLSMYSGHQIVYIDMIESASAIKVGVRIGTALPMYCTGMGKSVLAFLSEEALHEVLHNTSFQKRTAHTVENKEQLLEQLEGIRKNGCAMDNEEFAEGLISFAAPIFDHQNYPIAAVSISMPKLRYDESAHKQYVALIKGTASKISKELGHEKKLFHALHF